MAYHLAPQGTFDVTNQGFFAVVKWMIFRQGRPGLLALTVFLFGFAIGSGSAASMTPLALTGFNRDVVVENTASGPPYSAFAAELNPGEGNAFYQSGLPGKSFGFPV